MAWLAVARRRHRYCGLAFVVRGVALGYELGASGAAEVIFRRTRVMEIKKPLKSDGRKRATVAAMWCDVALWRPLR
jgi:hypothetical protein